MIDRPHPEATGNFHGWAMTLWGESIDPSKAKVWSFPADSVEAHETLAAAPSTTTLVGVPTATQSTQHSKPTNHLPDDHGSAPGESHEGFTDPNNKGGGNNSTAPNPEADTGYISGLKNSTLLFVAGGVVLIFAGSVAAFFWMRRGGRGRGGGGSGSGGGNGGYEFVPEDEEVAMSALERGRIKLGGGAGGAAGGGGRRTKELYDAFGEGGSEDEEDEENNALTGSGSGSSGRRGGLTRYVDEEDEDDDAEEGRQFVIEDEHEPYTPGTATKASGSGAYRDEPDEDQPEREEREREREMGKDREETASGSSGGSGSGGSWQDAGAEVKEP